MDRLRLALAAAMVLGGTTGSAQDPPRIRSGVDLVMVDVQVVDGRGRPVADLAPEDFRVFVGGQRRPVATAEFVRVAEAATGRAATAGAASAAAPLPGAPVRRMYVIAVDEHSIRVGAAHSAMEAARRFVARLQPADLVGLYSYPTGGAQVDLTDDHAKVLEGLGKVRALHESHLSQFSISPSEAIDIANKDLEVIRRVQDRECRTDAHCRRLIPLEGEAIALGYEMAATQSLGGLRELLSGLGDVPGRKIVILVSGGLIMTDLGRGRVNDATRMQEVGELAARSHVSLYGLHMDTRFQDTFAEFPRSRSFHRDEGLFMAGLERITGAAGGTLFRLQTGTADPAFDRVLLETSAHYLLGVEVAEADRDGQQKTIRVQVNRRGTTIRSRSSVVIPARSP